MEYIIVILLLLIIFLLWKYHYVVIPSSSNDWLILLWNDEKDEKKIYIDFLPIIGWTYRKPINSHGRYEPVTPFYGKKHRTDNEKILSYFWFRNGNQYEFTDDIRSFNKNLWEELDEYLSADVRVELMSNIPDCLKNKYEQIVCKYRNQRTV